MNSRVLNARDILRDVDINKTGGGELWTIQQIIETRIKNFENNLAELMIQANSGKISLIKWDHDVKKLEEQIKVMKKIYSREWKKVKKKIKKEKGLYDLTVKSEKERLKAEKESRRDDKTPAQDAENDKLAPQTQSDETEKSEQSESVKTSDERLAPVGEIKDESSNKETK